ncbi:hypothetical protein Lesp02_84300 [Lentzea sp. NBRC 105346]|nr:hypothetical protein Lesp02_84300 [Lentzea sp. NBRC 105346]
MPPLGSELSARELQVLRLLAQGLSNAAIGDRLGLALDTIRVFVRKVFARLGANDRAHAVRRGFELGLLAADPAASRSLSGPALSASQVEMLDLVSRGLTNVRIGQRMGITESVVVDRCRRLYRRLEARDRAHAVRRGFELGLLSGAGRGEHPMSPIRIPTIDERLAAIRARLAAATAGPWRVAPPDYGWTGPDGRPHEFVHVLDVDGRPSPVALTGPKHVDEQSRHDAEFIAAARADLPWLLAELDRLRAARMRGWDTALDSAQHAGLLSDQVDRQRAKIGELVAEVEELRAELADIGGSGEHAPYGVAPDEYEPADVATARQLWQAIRGQFDPCDAWDAEQIRALLRTFVAVLTRRRAELEPDTAPLREQLDRALGEDISEYIAPRPDDFGGYDIDRRALLDLVMDVVRPHLMPPGTPQGHRLLAEAVQRAEQLGWRTISVSRLAAIAAGRVDSLPAPGGDGRG